jgi:hypothetical protein
MPLMAASKSLAWGALVGALRAGTEQEHARTHATEIRIGRVLIRPERTLRHPKASDGCRQRITLTLTGTALLVGSRQPEERPSSVILQSKVQNIRGLRRYRG